MLPLLVMPEQAIRQFPPRLAKIVRQEQARTGTISFATQTLLRKEGVML